MQVELSLRRSFEWTFYVAAVSQALLGADYLYHFGLLVDVQKRQLVDPLTSLSTHVQPTPGASACLTVLKADTQFAALLMKFPTLLQPYSTAAFTSAKEALSRVSTLCFPSPDLLWLTHKLTGMTSIYKTGYILL